jgi:hypothetical protein
MSCRANWVMLFEASWSESAEPNFDVLLRSLVAQTVNDAQITLITVMKMIAKISRAPVSSSDRFSRVDVRTHQIFGSIVFNPPPFGPTP